MSVATLRRWHTFDPTPDPPPKAKVEETRQWDTNIAFFKQLSPRVGFLKSRVAEFAQLLSKTHWKTSEGDHCIISEYEHHYGVTAPRNVYDCLARIMTLPQILGVLDSIRDDALTSESFLAHPLAPEPNPLDRVIPEYDRTLMWAPRRADKADPYAGRGLEPTRSWGYEEDEGERKLWACCGQAIGQTDGCWFAMDSLEKNPGGVIIPYKLWFDDGKGGELWTALSLDAIDQATLARRIRGDYVIGTAFERPEFYRSLHSSMTSLLASIADDASSVYFNYAAVLDEALFVGKSVGSLTPFDLCTDSLRSSLERLLKLQATYNSPQLSRRDLPLRAQINAIVFSAHVARASFTLETRGLNSPDPEIRARAEEAVKRKRALLEEQERRRVIEQQERERERVRLLEEAAKRRAQEEDLRRRAIENNRRAEENQRRAAEAESQKTGRPFF
jgi:hypothetical protein